MSAGTNAPVIIKRKKVVAGGGHHGGAWKVAYADFVTAMMAFFMLMWLLNATTEKQRKGIADYFNPTIPINRISGGGDGSFGGESVFSEQVLPQNGIGASSQRTTEQGQARGQSGVDAGATGNENQTSDLKEVEKMLLARGGESMATQQALRHIVTRVTDEGLIIELFDLENLPLFGAGTDTPSDVLVALADIVTSTLSFVENDIAVGTHTTAEPIVLIENPAWQLSTKRAQVMRKLLMKAGFAASRIDRVTGFADRRPATYDPTNVRNNRVEIVVLRHNL